MSRGLVNTGQVIGGTLVRPNPNRVSIVFGLANTQRPFISLDLRKYGSLVTQGFQSNAFFGTLDADFWETILPNADFDSLEWAVRMSKTVSQQVTVTPPVAPGLPLIPPNEKRVALVIGPPLVGTLAISVNMDTNAGSIPLLAGGAPLLLNFTENGHLVRETFWLSHSLGGISVSFWEVLEP